MGVGNNTPYMGYDSAIGIAKETTLGTFVTATAFIEFNTESIKHARDEIKVEAINSTRDYNKRMLGKTTVSGAIEMPFNAASDACIMILKQALGGTCSSAAGSGTSYIHTLNTGNMEDNKATTTSNDMKGLSVSVRRGTSGSKVFNHYGCRVDKLSFKGEVGGISIMNAEFVGFGCSISSTIPTVSLSDVNPVNFIGCSIKTGDSIGNLALEYFKTFELSLNNALEKEHRVLGSTEIVGAPPQRRDITLKLSQLYDTTTAYDRFIQGTITAIQIIMDSQVTMGAGMTTYSCIISLPRCYLNSNNPVVDGSGALKQELEFRAYYSSNTNSTYSMQAEVRNLTASYD